MCLTSGFRLAGGSPIQARFTKHPNIFSDFYVNMVRSGEESGQLDKLFYF